MKKLLKSGICGSINSTLMHCLLQKSQYLQLLFNEQYMNSNRITPKCMKKKKKNKRNKNAAYETQTWVQQIQTYTIYSLKIKPFGILSVHACKMPTLTNGAQYFKHKPAEKNNPPFPVGCCLEIQIRVQLVVPYCKPTVLTALINSTNSLCFYLFIGLYNLRTVLLL